MKSGQKKLILGILFLVTGGLVVPLSLVLWLTMGQSQDDQFLVPGSRSFLIERPARYYLWHDHRTLFNGRSFNRPVEIPDAVTISVSDAAGEPSPFQSDGSFSVTSGSDASQSIGYVDLPTAGEWTVKVTGEAEPFVVSFAESRLLEIFGLIVGGVVLGLLLGGAGVVLIVIGVVRLAQRKP